MPLHPCTDACRHAEMDATIVRLLGERQDQQVEIDNLMARYRELLAAARNLCEVKGRHHSEIAMRRLMEVCGVERPNA